VWAPLADRVDLVVEGRRVEMAATPRGWWEVEVGDAGPGSRYGFSLDGGPVRPDPRSMSQPDGVDGWSEVVDHGRFPWSDSGWRGRSLAGSVIYELHVGTFTPAGTFEAAIDRIPHLVDLGIDTIELMPVAEFSGDHGWGYDGVDLFAPHHAYGGPDGLKQLIDACHRAGIAVITDVVYNHLGPAGNYLPEFGPYYSERHHTNWGSAINFDGPGSDEVRRFVIDNALMWLGDYHADGLRLDAVHAIVDQSACHVLEQLQGQVQVLAAQTGRSLMLIAESDLNDPRFVRPPLAGGYGLASSWADEWHHAVHAALTGERSGYYEDFGSLTILAKALRQAWVYDGSWSTHRQRTHGRPPVGLAGPQFVVCTQNHDQIGNRATGERTSALMSDGRLRVAAALLFTGPFIPLLFQGEEWGAATPFQYFTDHRDPDLGAAVSRGRRREFAAFGWDPEDVPDPQSVETFLASKLQWDELSKPPHAGLWAWYRHLIVVRRKVAELCDPRLSSVVVEVDETSGTLDVHRGPIGVFVNLGERPRTWPGLGGAALLAASDPAVRLDELTLTVPPDAVAIVQAT
jgi:maltooligosyltrehalose trehalohydrolase